ncbi:hypothetical protein NFI96_031876 [Prochilodus magdalenae]|nr:hypothetical protein NFI96_031876 [Prochilodus magdalenae]
MSYGQTRQTWNFLARHISSMFTDGEMKQIRKRTPSLLWNMEEALLCSGVLNGVLQGTMESQGYHRILERNVQVMCRSWVLQQDNDPKHTSKTPRNDSEETLAVLKWPSMSPDLNPIEHLWKELKPAVWKRHPSYLRQLEQCAHEEWTRIPAERCRSLSDRLFSTNKNKLLLLLLMMMMMMMVLKTLLWIFILLGLLSESAELWRLHHGVSYLFSEAEGSCAEAQKFCRQKHSEVATMTNANKDWIASQAEGRKLWINMEGIVTGPPSMTVQQCPEKEGSNPTQLNSSEKRDWMCERRREETANIPQRFIRAAASDGDDDEHSNEYSEGVTAEFEEYDYVDYYNSTVLIDFPPSTAASVLSVKTYVIAASVVSLLYPLGRLSTL